MKVKDVMTKDPECCLPSDSAQTVAKLLRDQDIGSVPVVSDKRTRKLAGIITDRDLCCSIVADGLNPQSTTVEKYFSRDVATCKPEDDLDACEKVMQQSQVRRIPIVDESACCVGIVSQADLALKEKAEKVSRTVAEISKPSHAEAQPKVAV